MCSGGFFSLQLLTITHIFLQFYKIAHMHVGPFIPPSVIRMNTTTTNKRKMSTTTKQQQQQQSASTFSLVFGIIVVIGVLLGVPQTTLARPAEGDAQAQIVKFENDVRLDGYDFAYETSNGIKRTESGSVKPGAGPDDALLNVNGEFSFNFPDGTPFTLKFVASEDGYRPVLTIGAPKSG